MESSPPFPRRFHHGPLPAQGWSKGRPCGRPRASYSTATSDASPVRQRVAGLRHVRGPEQVAGQEPLVGGAGRPLDDDRQQAVAHVRVAVRRAGCRAQRGGERPDDELPTGEWLVVGAEYVDQPGRVGEQLLDGDVRLVRRHRPEPPSDRVVHVEPAEHLELDHRRGGELLGHASRCRRRCRSSPRGQRHGPRDRTRGTTRSGHRASPPACRWRHPARCGRRTARSAPSPGRAPPRSQAGRRATTRRRRR